MDATSPGAYLDTRYHLTRPRQVEWDTMYYPLALKGRGSPIQTPDVQLNYPIEHRMMDYSMWDVILLDFWGFIDFQFNTFVPADSPLNGLLQDIRNSWDIFSTFPLLIPLTFMKMRLSRAILLSRGNRWGNWKSLAIRKYFSAMAINANDSSLAPAQPSMLLRNK